MSHTPPVPEANTSPYPIQEPPHPHVEAVPQASADEEAGETSGVAVRFAPIGAVVALGVAALGTIAYLVSGRRGRDAKPRKRNRKR